MIPNMFDKPSLTISAAAEATGLHPQTIRQYEQRGLITPARTAGGTRMYSMRDLMKLDEISALSSMGVSIEGILKIFEMEAQMDEIKSQMEEMIEENMALRSALHRERRYRRAMTHKDNPLLPPGA